MKILLGFLLAFVIGIVCRLVVVPLPAPPVLIGALLVVAMSAGYMLVDRYARHREAANRVHCGGPSGTGASSSRDPS
jgi:XapX domain-containing protein